MIVADFATGYATRMAAEGGGGSLTGTEGVLVICISAALVLAIPIWGRLLFWWFDTLDDLMFEIGYRLGKAKKARLRKAKRAKLEKERVANAR